MGDDGRGPLLDVVAAACPELKLKRVAAALEATITNPAVARSLTAALAAADSVVTTDPSDGGY